MPGVCHPTAPVSRTGTGRGARKGPATVLACLLVFVVVFAAPCYAQDESGVTVWKLSTIAPKRFGWSEHIQALVNPAVEQATEGTVRLKWYWGGVLGDDEAALAKIRAGRIQGMGFSGQGLAMVSPELTVLELPFLFNDYGEVEYLYHKMRDTYDRYTEKHGFKLLYYADQDFDQVYSTDFPIEDVADFARARFVSWYGPVEEAVLSHLGAHYQVGTVTQIPERIKSGELNAFIAPSMWAVGAQMHAAVKYVNPIKIRYSPAGVIVSLEAWNALPGDYQEDLLATRDELAPKFWPRARKDSQRALSAMYQYGVKSVYTTPSELSVIKSRCRPVWDELAGRQYPRELLDEILGHLEEYRSTKE